ncbi:MAG: phage tail protein [Cyanobacteriota bacterium]|nr:phage tail protein [Cyanobacteriota bacterium]
MFAQLGDIQFDLITYFDGINDTITYNYAEHERINNKTLLQFLGENLQEFTIKLNLHSSFCVPEEEILKIRTEAKLGKPLKFIKGNGEYVGAFVISQIQKTTEQTSPEGDLIAIQVELQLKEYAGKIPEDEEEQQGLKKKE